MTWLHLCMHHINQVISCMQIYNGKHFLLLNYSEMKELNWEFKGVGKEESWGTKGIQLKSHAVNKIKKSSDQYKELSRQKLWSRPHQHVPPTDLCWITAVTWRSCVCVVLSVSGNPRAFGCCSHGQCYSLEQCPWEHACEAVQDVFRLCPGT